MWNIFFNIFLIGIVTFGGGQVFIPLFKDLLLDKLKLLSKTEFFNMLGFINAYPGPIATKIAIYSGFIANGFLGMCFAAIAIAGPGFLIMYYSCSHIEKVKNHRIIKSINIFIKPIIVAIFLALAYGLEIMSLDNLNLIHNLILTLGTILLLSIKKIKFNLISILFIAIVYGLIFF